MIYLLRHGEIDRKYEKCYIGQIDVPLSPVGLRQAELWKEKLSQVCFDVVYSSDLIRAVETAEIVSGLNRSDLQVEPNLREIDLGEWDGVPMQKIRAQFPVAWKDRGKQIATFRTPDGESFQDLHDRVVPMFEGIAVNQKGHVLIVAHAGVLRVILCHAMGKPTRELFSIPQDPAALNQIDYRQGMFFVVSQNRTP